MTTLRKPYTAPRLEPIPTLDSYTIAAIIALMPTHAATLRAQRESCANAFADAFAAIYPRFNRDTFIAAATVTGDNTDSDAYEARNEPLGNER